MKKKFICMILLFIVIFSFQITASARAGGGGSGGSSGGGSGGGTSGSHTTSHSQTSGNPVSSVVVTVIQIGSFVLLSSGGFLLIRMKALRFSHLSKDILKDIEGLEGNWNYKYLQKSVVEAYYIIQKSWAGMNLAPAKDYLSERLCESFHAKLEWMVIRHERPVQDYVKLIRAYPLAVHDEQGQENDYIWYYIEGSMTGYYIDTDTGNVIRGNVKPERFIEYWKFVKQNNRWVLDEIMQKDDADIESFAFK